MPGVRGNGLLPRGHDSCWKYFLEIGLGHITYISLGLHAVDVYYFLFTTGDIGSRWDELAYSRLSLPENFSTQPRCFVLASRFLIVELVVIRIALKSVGRFVVGEYHAGEVVR